MTPFVLRPFFIRSVLATGLIVGAAFALLAHRRVSPVATECSITPQLQAASLDPPDQTTTADDDVADREDGDSYALVVEQENPACEYFSSFTDDEVELAPGTKLAVFERDFAFEDGCDWKSEERLERIDAVTFRYTYKEHPVACKKGHHAQPACTRSGIVTSAPLVE